MLEKYEMPDGLWNFISKILIPAIVGAGFGLAIEMKKTNAKVSFFNFLLSIGMGLLAATMFQYPVEMLVPEHSRFLVIALIAMCSQKIGEFIMYKWRVDTLITGFLNWVISGISSNNKKDQ